MKKQLLLSALLLATRPIFSQPQVHFVFVTHNEETTQWNGPAFYTSNRAKLITLANYFQTNGVAWNMQSDWVYLTNVLNQETPALMATTNGKNILRWMLEDKGVEMDPHAHESQYLYPDVVKLMDSIGLPESKVIGGTIYNDNNGINIWTNLVNGQYGLVFPNHFWHPEYMMGGGTPNHVADIKYYGFWNPQSPDLYLTHDTSSHLRHIGLGCEIRIQTTTEVADIVADIKDVVDKVQSGQYPSDGFYLQNIFFEQGDLNNLTFYNKVIAVADSVNALVGDGVALWKTLKQAYTQWETVDQARAFQWNCGAVVPVVEQYHPSNAIRLFPNPFTSYLQVESPGTIERMELLNALGQLVWSGISIVDTDFSGLPGGVYIARIFHGPGSSYTLETLLKQ